MPRGTVKYKEVTCLDCGQKRKVRSDVNPKWCVPCGLRNKKHKKGQQTEMTAEYKAVHQRMQRTKPKTSRCAYCKHLKEHTQWAYVGGTVSDMDNYIELCWPCHYRLDKRQVVLLWGETG